MEGERRVEGGSAEERKRNVSWVGLLSALISAVPLAHKEEVDCGHFRERKKEAGKKQRYRDEETGVCGFWLARE